MTEIVSNKSLIKKVRQIKYNDQSAIMVKYCSTDIDDKLLKLNDLMEKLHELKVNIPRILSFQMKEKCFIIEHCGLPLSSDIKRFSLHNIIEKIIDMNNLDIKLADSVYRMTYADVLARLIYALNTLNFQMTPQLYTEIVDLSSAIDAIPKKFIHGDIHLDNLTYKNNNIFFIDFGLACLGPYLYDVVSLLNDPRLGLSYLERINLVSEVYDDNQVLKDYFYVEMFRNIFTLASFQELYDNSHKVEYKNYFNTLLEYMKKKYLQSNIAETEMRKGVLVQCKI